MQGKKQYQEKLFTNFHLSERIPQENFYRQLKEVLPLQWLYKTTKKYYGSEGQSSIDPVFFFKLMLIGYLKNLGSDRRIISTFYCRVVAEPLLTSCCHIAKPCNMPATNQQQCSKELRRKQQRKRTKVFQKPQLSLPITFKLFMLYGFIS